MVSCLCEQGVVFVVVVFAVVCQRQHKKWWVRLEKKNVIKSGIERRPKAMQGRFIILAIELANEFHSIP